MRNAHMKPIQFNAEMVRAILDGRKTVTRRVCKITVNDGITVDHCRCAATCFPEINRIGPCANFFTDAGYYTGASQQPYKIGDILYVRETWNYGYIRRAKVGSTKYEWFEPIPLDYAGFMKNCCHYVYRADFTEKEESELGVVHDDGNFRIDWRPSTNMPKEAARIFLRVKGVRVERLRDIPLFDVWDEGTPQMPGNDDKDGAVGHEDFVHLWNSALKPADLPRYGWDANPWVWRIEFERINREEAFH